MKPSHLFFSILVLSPLHPFLAPAPLTSAELAAPAAVAAPVVAAPAVVAPIAAPSVVPALPASAVAASAEAASPAPSAAEPAGENRPGSGLFDGSRPETSPRRVLVTPGRRIGNPQRQFERELGL